MCNHLLCIGLLRVTGCFPVDRKLWLLLPGVKDLPERETCPGDITVNRLSQRDKFRSMCVYCAEKCILKEGGTVLSKWLVKQCTQSHSGFSLRANTGLFHQEHSGAFSCVFVLNQSDQCAHGCRNFLAVVKSQGRGESMKVHLRRKEKKTTPPISSFSNYFPKDNSLSQR